MQLRFLSASKQSLSLCISFNPGIGKVQLSAEIFFFLCTNPDQVIDVKIQSIYTFESFYSNHVFISVAFPVNNIIPPANTGLCMLYRRLNEISLLNAFVVVAVVVDVFFLSFHNKVSSKVLILTT